jgi:hypothetical protein
MQRSSNEVQVQSPLRPHSLAALLNLIQLVMHPNETVSTLQLVSPRVDLDLAQTIIVRWAETVPWSWATWDDQRIANAESITFLVSGQRQISPADRDVDRNMAISHQHTLLRNNSRRLSGSGIRFYSSPGQGFSSSQCSDPREQCVAPLNKLWY